MVVCLREFTGPNVMSYYSSNILRGAYDNHEISVGDTYSIRVVNLGMGVSRMVTAATAGSFLDKFGRKPLYLLGDAIITVAMGLLSVALWYKFEFLAKFMVLQSVVGASLSFGLINPIYVAETLPFRGACLMNVIMGLATFISLTGFSFLSQETSIGLGAAVGIFCVFGMLGFIGCKLFLKETQGLTMDQIYDMFSGRKEEREDYQDKVPLKTEEN